jgi:hypothetical protein
VTDLDCRCWVFRVRLAESIHRYTRLGRVPDSLKLDACKSHVIVSAPSVDNGKRQRKRVMNRLLTGGLDELVPKDDACVQSLLLSSQNFDRICL